MKLAVLFPGQGSQFVGMAQEFIQQDSECKDLMAEAEKVCGLELNKLCSEGPMEELIRATNLQPAITIVNLICYHALQKELQNIYDVSYFAGHSLGEYSALCAAKVLKVEDTLRLVAKRGALMEREGIKNPGGMRAVLGLTISEVEEEIAKYNGAGVATVANYNTPQQIVISGTMEGLDDVAMKFEGRGAKVIPLNVSVANHSPLVADAVPDYKDFMSTIEFSEPQTPVVFNVTAQTETNCDEIKSIMARQIATRVRWCESIELMIENGVDTFIEVGPKSVLKGMMRKILPKGSNVVALQFDSPDGMKKCFDKIG